MSQIDKMQVHVDVILKCDEFSISADTKNSLTRSKIGQVRIRVTLRSLLRISDSGYTGQGEACMRVPCFSV